jgi:hypothetical protein
MIRGNCRRRVFTPPVRSRASPISLVRDVTALILLTGMLLGCSNFHHQAYRLKHPQIQDSDYVLNFVEADDEGWFWDPSQAKSALQTIKDSADSRDTIVLVYTHGWHHSAACCDDNVEGFKEVLKRLHDELGTTMFRTAREQAHAVTGATNEYRVVGIYVGWRGGSLPGLLDYLTFWGRKSAAKRVGETDLSEFMSRLRMMYDEHNAPRRADGAPPAKTYLGLVTVGHSFGSQVVLRAVSQSLEQRLVNLGAATTFLRQTDTPPAVPLSAPARGYGDLIVLINPAVEAAAYERLRMLSTRFNYTEQQTPLMLTLSADNDQPRHKLFQWGREVGEFFTATPHKADPRERGMERQALGFYDGPGPQGTHRLTPVDPNVKLISATVPHTPEPYCDDAGHCSCQFFDWAAAPTITKPDALPSNVDVGTTPGLEELILKYDFSSSTVFANVSLDPLPGGVPYQPMILASVPPTVIDGHNGMFSQPLLNFLIKYIGFIEAKRYLITASEKQWMTPP